MVEVAKLIRRHLPNLLTYLQHGITNAGVKALTATIPWVKKPAPGFRNMEQFKTAIYFQCGGLDLCPHKSWKSQKMNRNPAIDLRLPLDSVDAVLVTMLG